jgi:hypothetical protein
MDCSERRRLFDIYYDRVIRYATVRELLFDSGTGAPEEERMLSDTRTAADLAQMELERHEREHGCGQRAAFSAG